ncbi:DUF397 domain-containing protein [Actinomadura vinacea]|uniref:DUF397 domain-containing protein n=1 Tax=Actinomadura vinacea TaxID=115336 RepID=UPI003CD0A0A1
MITWRKSSYTGGGNDEACVESAKQASVRPGGRSRRAGETHQGLTVPRVTGRESGPTVKNDGE